MRKLNTLMGVAGSLATLGLALACAGEVPTATSSAATAGTGHIHAAGPALAASAPRAVRSKIVELRQWSASFHDLDAAAAAGYTTSIGCIDETINGVDPASARGMGFHVGGGSDGLAYVLDFAIDIDQPEFLVYAPNQAGGSLENARLVGFDYFLPGPNDAASKPAPLLGTEFVYSNAFSGWMAHIYLWGHNPEGMFANWNGKVNLCTAS